METNSCEHGYFRCRNGLCIPESLLYDLTYSVDCLDTSDAFGGYDQSPTACFHSPPTSYDEYSCEHSMMFACGSGGCKETSLFQDDNDCGNGRSLIYTRAMLQNQNGYLSDECWKTIICSFRLQYIFDIDCSKLCASNYCNKVIKKICPPEFMFPLNPLLSNSIRLVYNTTTKTKWVNDVTPTYICYDIQRCKSLLRSSVIEVNDTMCQKYEEFSLKDKYKKWNDLLIDMIQVFKACSLPGLEIVTDKLTVINYNDHHICPHLSLIHCKGSSRCISKYRITDGHQDCFNSYDEHYNHSCLLNLTHRQQCEYRQNCIPLATNSQECKDDFDPLTFLLCEFFTWFYVCKYLIKPNPGLPFGKLCNQLIELEPDSKDETDETNCPHDWPCYTRYTKCDNYWHCKNGVDEVNCNDGLYSGLQKCDLNEHYCQRPNANDIGCIHIEDIKSDKVQCLGSTDQRDFCKQKYPKDIQRRYRCLNSSECVNVLELCDCKEDYLLGDDEYMVCPWLRNFTCDPDVFRCKNGDTYKRQARCNGYVECEGSNEDEMYCDLIDFFHQAKAWVWSTTDGFSTYPAQVSSVKSSAAYDDDLPEALDDSFPGTSDDLDYSCESNYTESPFLYWYCNAGILAYTAETFACLCPPAYYGDWCQYQSDRISVMILIRKQTAFERNVVFKFVFFLLDNKTDFISTEQIIYMQSKICEPRYNIYLSYDHQTKMSTNYSIRVDAYSLNAFDNRIGYRASWNYHIPFDFLPAFKLVIDPVLPETKIESTGTSRLCEHGQWLPYINSNRYFCLCDAGWSGKSCNVSYECQCSKNSLCIGRTALTKTSICLCELEQFGTLCYIPNTACQSNTCLNNGKCVSLDQRETSNFHCICTQEYHGDKCQYHSFGIHLKFIDIAIPSAVLIHLVRVRSLSQIMHEVIFQRIRLDIENDITIYVQKFLESNIGYAEINENYYILFLFSEDSMKPDSISSYVSSANRCPHIRELFDETIIKLHLLRRAKYYHRPCLEQHHLLCFYDEIHMCLCDEKHQTDCYGFRHNRTYDCEGHNYCLNNALCFHDELRCPAYSKCVCRECFYGTRCQFTTSSYSLTLDSIIGPYISPNIAFQEQPLMIKLSLTVTVIICLISLTDNTLSVITFSQKNLSSTGCGVYLLFSSIASTLTTIIFTYKFIYSLCTHLSSKNYSIYLYINCLTTDFCLKFLPSMNSWFNACVAIERVVCTILGTKFNKKKSRRMAIIISLVVVFSNITSAIHDPLFRQLVDSDERIWCVTTYHRKPWLDLYNKIILIINLILPFSINFISAIGLITITAYIKLRTTAEQRSYGEYLGPQFKLLKHLIISPLILIALSLPRLILSYSTGCMESEREASIFLTLYFLSFLPSTTTFIVFVLPSQVYLNELYCTLKRYRKNIKRLLRVENDRLQ